MTLPPQIASSYCFGSLVIHISSIAMLPGYHSSGCVCYPLFMGDKQPHRKQLTLNTPNTFPIATTLWHFYLYLTDLEVLPFQIIQSHNKYLSRVPILTLPPNVVLTTQFTSANILTMDQKQYDILDEQGTVVGKMAVSLATQFDGEVHALVRDVVNFKDMLVIEGISRIASQIQMPRIPPTQSFFQQQPISHEDQKAINDDIDRMIAQMQQKPYDSSRYLENNPNTPNHPMPTHLPPKQTDTHTKPPHTKPPLHRNNSTLIQTHHSDIPNVVAVRSKSTERNQTMHIPESPSELKLHIHQLLTTAKGEDEGQLTMMINGVEEDMKLRGIQHGDAIIFNHIKIFHNSKPIKQLLFRYKSDDKELVGMFNIERVFGIPNRKGFFMIPLLHHNRPDRKVGVGEVKAVDAPIHRTLRIELEMKQIQQLVQVYIHLSHFKINCSSVRYTIPFTKDVIEFTESTHFNIFPHSKQSPTIIFQFWRDTKLEGVSQISLKGMKSLNNYTINASISPIYLHEGQQPIISLFKDAVVGTYHLILCFGTVRQIQTVLKGQNTKKPQKDKVQVKLDDKMGVYVKEKKNITSTECQVDIPPEIPQNNIVDTSKHIPQQPTAQFHPSQHNLNADNSRSSSKSAQGSQMLALPNQIPHIQSNNQTKTTNKKQKGLLEDVGEYIKYRLKQLTDPQILQQLKSSLKPHILYNVVTSQNLAKCLFKVGISRTKARDIIQQILNPVNNLVNVNILYDYIACLQINGFIKVSLIPDSLLTYYTLSLLGAEGGYPIDHQTDWQQMKNIMKEVGYKLTMHQYNIIHQHLLKMNRQKSLNGYLESIKWKIERDKLNEQFQKADQEQVIKQLYGNIQIQENSENQFLSHEDSNITVDLKQTIKHQPKYPTIKPQQKQISFSKQQKQVTIKNVKKQIKTILRIEGLKVCKESAQCLLDISMQEAYLKLLIRDPIIQSFTLNADSELQIENALEEISGEIRLCKGHDIIANAGFAIVEGIKSVYALKRNYQFCGLINILIQKKKG